MISDKNLDFLSHFGQFNKGNLIVFNQIFKYNNDIFNKNSATLIRVDEVNYIHGAILNGPYPEVKWFDEIINHFELNEEFVLFLYESKNEIIVRQNHLTSGKQFGKFSFTTGKYEITGREYFILTFISSFNV